MKNAHEKRENDIERLIEDVAVQFFAEKDRQSETFAYDIALVMLTYLRDRELGFTVEQIRESWGKPSRKKNYRGAILFFTYFHPIFLIRKN